MIPKSLTKERIKQNYEALDIKLDEGDMDKLNQLDQGKRKFDPKGWDAPQYNWKFVPIFE